MKTVKKDSEELQTKSRDTTDAPFKHVSDHMDRKGH